jgi:hypothetical protein
MPECQILLAASIRAGDGRRAGLLLSCRSMATFAVVSDMERLMAQGDVEFVLVEYDWERALRKGFMG